MILLITTGGTIACTKTENGLSPTLTGSDILSYAQDKKDIEVLDFKLIDSSIMTDTDRKELCHILYDNKDKYDGFVITHGTDSMAYTAGYIDNCLENFDKTVVITGSQLPLVQEGNDATDNLNLAIQTAKQGFFGVCLAIFKRVISAKTVTKIETEGFTAFESVTREYLTQPINKPTDLIQFKEYKDNRVSIIYITPVLTRNDILMFANFDSLIVVVLGAGGMLKEQEKAFEDLKLLGVNIYIRSQCVFGQIENIYEAHSGVSKFTPVTKTSIDWLIYSLKF